MSSAKEELKKLTAEEKGCVDFPSLIFTYGCYHNNPVNKLIHLFGIPIIVYCIGVLAIYFFQIQVIVDFLEKLNMPTDPLLLFTIFSWLPLTIIYSIADIGVALGWAFWTIPGGLLLKYMNDNYKDADHFGMSQFTFYLVL